MKVHIEMLNLTRREAYTRDGVTGQITKMLDAYGAETEDTEEAASVTILWPDGMFTALNLEAFDVLTRETIH